MPERTAPLTAILHAAAQVLDCDSAILGQLSEDRQFLELSVGGTRAGLNVAAVETALGFAVSGLRLPLTVTESILVRALRQERLLVSHDVTEVAGGALPPEMMQAVRDIVGTRSYAVVPIIGRSGALGVLFVDKAGHSTFTNQERDTLLAYAERVGAALESEALSDEAQRLERLGAQPPPPPQILLCRPGPGDEGAILYAETPGGLLPLHQHLGLPDPAALYDDDLARRLATFEVVTVTAAAASQRPSAESTRRALRWDLPPSIQVPLPEPPTPPPRQYRLSLRLASAAGPLLCVVEDLSPAEALRRELRLSQEHLSKVMHSVGDVILTVDAGGVIRQANEAAGLVLGVPPERLPGRSVLSLVASERGRAQLSSLRERVQRSGYAERYLHLRRGATVAGAAPPADDAADPQGVRFPARVSALLLCDDSGRPAGAVLRISDQSQRRRGDQELRRLRSRLVQSERLSALGEMAARIAHEVRNPLVSIGAAAQVVAEELPADSPVRGEALAIGAEVRRLDGIITDFLRFARPRRREAVAADVAQVLRQVVELARQRQGGVTGLTLRLRTPEAGLHALVDPDGLKQVLWNVLLNACEATLAAAAPGLAPPSGAIPGPRPVDCEARRHRSGRVLLTIADRGPGVPVALRRRVFDPFFSTKARGTGLGLSICRQILEEQGGRVRLLNRPGGGTRVVIELRPAGPASAAEQAAARRGPTDNGV